MKHCGMLNMTFKALRKALSTPQSLWRTAKKSELISLFENIFEPMLWAACGQWGVI